MIPWRRKWQPTPVFLPGESLRQKPGGLQSMGNQRVRHDYSTEIQHRQRMILTRHCISSAVSNSFWPHELQHARPPCPSPTPGVYSNSCPLSWWCHPTISSSVIPFSSHLQSFPASGSFQMSQLFTLGGQSNGVSASTSVLPMNVQD